MEFKSNLPYSEDHWKLHPRAAAALQCDLAPWVVSQPFHASSFILAGIDTGYQGDLARAAVILMQYPELSVIEISVAQRRVQFPYRSGLLAFREGPVVLDALKGLHTRPQLLLIDGQGVAHPRRFGIACHIGLLTNLPSIGCAKTCLVGQYQAPPSDRGSFSHLTIDHEVIGAVVRTRSHVKPIYISVGHKIELSDCIRIVIECCRGYRLPEPIRRAHRAAAER